MLTLTRQIIQEVIDKSIKSALVYTNKRIDGMESRFDGLESRFDKMEKKFDIKFDKVMEQLTDIAGQFKKFDEEQVFLSNRVSIHTDQIEQLQIKVFGSAQA